MKGGGGHGLYRPSLNLSVLRCRIKNGIRKIGRGGGTKNSYGHKGQKNLLVEANKLNFYFLSNFFVLI
jgi:hypothetical protein